MESKPRIAAVLGPTNTGKTHLAIERMAGHASGMIGFPLRLLARENYERVVRLKGARNVALVTGEEKIVPPGARYFLCTVESMPLDRPVDFLAVDEIQLCGDGERGHVFTDRLLHARGRTETMMLGAETIKPLIRRLVPGVEFITRPRLSTLSYTGPRKLTRLPRRSAVVAFSASDVYGIADLVRRQRGGAAVVLGALSPRTRNAQVALYQAGEVDYLVATDAIGMGLNMDVDHVAFAELVKFDGRAPRRLSSAELAQIAGRAGRHMNDGSFGVTGECPPLEADEVRRIEEHEFEPLARLFWRNTDLDFRSIERLRASLARRPEAGFLMRRRDADDELALEALSRDPAVRERAGGRAAVHLLWEVCRIPDFRKTMSDAHQKLLGQVFLHLTGPEARLPTDWVAEQIARLDNLEGDIDALTARIAHIRTWTYVAHRADWLDDTRHWQGVARGIEDRLSDALHERLTQRFVDRRAAVLVRRLKDGGALLGSVDQSGGVAVEGQHIGRLRGLAFSVDAADAVDPAARRPLLAAARRVLPGELARRVAAIAGDDHGAFCLDRTGRILWRGEPLARLAPGRDVLAPEVRLLADDAVEGAARERVRVRLATWLERHLEEALGPLFRARAAPLAGAARGLAFQVAEGLGLVRRAAAQAQVAALTADDRRRLAGAGIRIGTETIHLPAALKPRAAALKALLWSVHHRCEAPLEPPAPGRVSVPSAAGVPDSFYEAVGYLRLGALVVRADMAERVAARLRELARSGPFAPSSEVLSLAGCGLDEADGMLRALGFCKVDRADGAGGPPLYVRRSGRGKAGRRAGRRARPRVDPDSPFAVLGEAAE